MVYSISVRSCNKLIDFPNVFNCNRLEQLLLSDNWIQLYSNPGYYNEGSYAKEETPIPVSQDDVHLMGNIRRAEEFEVKFNRNIHKDKNNDSTTDGML